MDSYGEQLPCHFSAGLSGLSVPDQFPPTTSVPADCTFLCLYHFLHSFEGVVAMAGYDPDALAGHGNFHASSAVADGKKPV